MMRHRSNPNACIMYAQHVYLCGASHDAAAASVGGKASHKTGEDKRTSSSAGADTLYDAGVQKQRKYRTVSQLHFDGKARLLMFTVYYCASFYVKIK